jgi:hypothetical protein
VIGRGALAGLSVLLAAWSAEGATVYRRATARPPGALAAIGGPSIKPSAVIGGPYSKPRPAIGGPFESKAGPSGVGRSRGPRSGPKSVPGAPDLGGQGARPAAAGKGASPTAAARGPATAAARIGRGAPKGRRDGARQ